MRKTEADGLPGGQMGKQGVILENHADTSPFRWQTAAGSHHFASAQTDHASLRSTNSSDQAQKCRFSGTRGTKQSHQLTNTKLWFNALENPIRGP